MAQEISKENQSLLPRGLIATQTNSDGVSTDAYVLSQAQWLSVQTYVNDGMQLPTNDSQFLLCLGLGTETAITDDFSDMYKDYADIKVHCSWFRNEVVDQSLQTARDTKTYSDAYVTALPQIQTALDQIAAGKPVEGDVARAKHFVDALKKVAKSAGDNVQTCKNNVTMMLNFTQDDGANLSKLNAVYKKKYSDDSERVQSLKVEMAQEETELKNAQDEYNQDVVVAATTPTYGWMFPAGTLAGAVVAGVYTKKAIDAKNNVNRLKKEISNDRKTLAALGGTLDMIDWALSRNNQLEEEIRGCLPVFEKMSGIWGAISNDLEVVASYLSAAMQSDAGTASAWLAFTEDPWRDAATKAGDYAIYGRPTFYPESQEDQAAKVGKAQEGELKKRAA